MHVGVIRAPVTPPPITIVTVEMSAEEARRLQADLFTLAVGRGMRPAWSLQIDLAQALASK